MAKSTRVTGIALLVGVVLFVAWYCVAADYDYSTLSGTYTFRGDGESSTLILKSDRSFQQELVHGGTVEHKTGTWRRIGESGVTFSKEFLRLPGQQSYRDKFGPDTSGNTEADGEFGGNFDKILTVYPELHLDAVPANLTLHKKISR